MSPRQDLARFYKRLEEILNKDEGQTHFAFRSIEIGGCWACNASACGVGMYRGACGTSSDAECEACTGKPPNASYVTSGQPWDADNCTWQCHEGYWRSGETCVSCTTSSCGAGQYRGQGGGGEAGSGRFDCEGVCSAGDSTWLTVLSRKPPPCQSLVTGWGRRGGGGRVPLPGAVHLLLQRE